MVERIDKEEGRIRAKDEIERASSELNAALLLLKGVEPKTHEGIERMFGLYYIKTNEFDLAIGKTIGRLMKMREEADYYPEIPSTQEESDEAIKMAKDFTEKAKKLL